MDKLRGVISGQQHDDVEQGLMATSRHTSDEVAQRSPSSSRPPPPEEDEEKQEEPTDGEERAARNSGSVLRPLPPSAEATRDAAPAPVHSMNMQLWELEENKPVGCDTSKPPGEENQVRRHQKPSDNFHVATVSGRRSENECAPNVPEQRVVT